MKTAFSFHDPQHLSQFFGAYLHQDFHLDYASPALALDDFKKHATPEQLAAFTKDFHAFLTAAEHVPFAAVQTWWSHKMGSGWFPSNKNDLLALQQRLQQTDIK